MALTTRLFGPGDTVNLWEILNEIKGWIDTLSTSGISARYWTGTMTTKNISDDKYTSVRMGNQVEATGGVAPIFDGDAFSLAAGRYRIDAQLRFDQASGGYRSLSLMKNPGITTYSSTSSPPGTYLRSAQFASSSNDTTVQLTKLLTVTANDKLLLIARQTSGGTTGLVGNVQDSELMIQRLGD